MGGEDDDEKMRKTRVIIIPRSVGRSVDGWLGPSPAVRIRTPFLFLSSPSPSIHPPHSLPLPNPNNNNNNHNNNIINYYNHHNNVSSLTFSPLYYEWPYLRSVYSGKRLMDVSIAPSLPVRRATFTQSKTVQTTILPLLRNRPLAYMPLSLINPPSRLP